MTVKRRDLFAAGAGGAMTLLMPRAHAQSLSQPGSILNGTSTAAEARNRIIGTPNGIVACAARQHPLPQNSVIDSTNNTLNQRGAYAAPAACDITDIVLAYPGSAQISTGEADLPVATVTVTASIEYPAGTFTPAYVNGGRSLTVTAGRTMAKFDPIPLVIPAGQTFWVKTFASWSTGTFWLNLHGGAELNPGTWCNKAIGAADNTLTSTVLGTSGGNYQPIIYGRLATPVASVGILGDSISESVGDVADAVTQAIFLEKAFRGQIPVLNVSINGTGFNTYLTRNQGIHMNLRDTVTHLILSWCRNDLQGHTAADAEGKLLTVLAPFLDRGVKVWGVTCLPTATSSDNFATTANQTVANSGNETQRLLYNTWLRSNYASIGLQGYFDWARAVDPTDSGKWSVDGAPGKSAAGFPVMSGRAISSVAIGAYWGGQNSGGSLYPISSTIPCVVRPMPGDTGTGGGVVTMTTNGSGVGTAFNVTSGGDYDFAPLVAPQGSWTLDGVHPSPRGCNEIIWATGLRPGLFTV